ncbi:MAG: S8 family serine peptidase [Vicinamibacterales bacterium]
MARSPWLLAVLLVVASGGLVTRTQSTVTIAPDLAARAQGGALVDVLVGVESTFALEGRLRTATEIRAQRAAIARNVDDVSARVAAAGGVVGERFDAIPFFRARVTAAGLAALAQLRGVTSIEENLPNHQTATDTVPFVNAPPAWSAGATGAGWNVAVLDSGVDSAHPFFGGRVVGEACYSGGGTGAISLCPGGATSSTAAGSAAPCNLGAACLHGTAVAGVAVGANGPSGLSGVAPAAGLIPIMIGSRSDAAVDCGAFAPCLVYWDADIVSGLNRVATLAGAGNTGRIAAVNLSLASFVRYNSQSACDTARPALKAASTTCARWALP